MTNIFQLSTAEAQKQVVETFSSDEKFCYSDVNIRSSMRYMICDDTSAVECLEVVRSKKIKHVLQNSVQSLQDKLAYLKQIDYRSEDYFDDKMNFLSAEVYSARFNAQNDRNQLLTDAFRTVGLDTDATKNQYLYQVGLELVMNAQIDAPKISSKNHAEDSILIIEKNPNKGLVSISVIDFYGSLDCYKMLENIYAAHKNGFRNSMSKNSIGAGLGSALIYEYADSLLIGVIPDQKSRVTAILPFGVSEKRMTQIQKSLHIIKE